MKLRFTPRAINDIEEIAAYIRVENRAAAVRVRSAIFESLRNLADFPKLGRRQTVKDVRKFVTRKYPYLVFYRVDEANGEVIVLAVQHPAKTRTFSDT